MTEQTVQTEAIIDLATLRDNLRMLRARVAPAELMFVVKDDAYAHGLEPVAQAAAEAGIRRFGTLDLETSLRLRRTLPEVTVFAWLFDPREDFAAAVAAGVELGLSSLSLLERAAAVGAPHPARVHLKIDTGLHRAGASVEDWPDLVRRAVALEREGRLELVGAWTHIAEASEEEDSLAVKRFSTAVAAGEGQGARFEVRHLAASAAAFERSDSRFDLVRIGAFGYGIAPGGGVGPESIGVTPVMTLQSAVTGVDGSEVRVGIGFGDGLLGDLAGRASVLIRGRRHVIREVRPDELVVDARGELSIGDRVLLFGSGAHGEATLQEWADALDTIGEEIAVRVSPRVPRRYVG